MTYADKLRDYASDKLVHPENFRGLLREAADKIDLLELEVKTVNGELDRYKNFLRSLRFMR